MRTMLDNNNLSLIFQYMRDSGCLEYTFSISHNSRYVSLGSQSIHSYPTENVNHEKTSLSNGEEKVNRTILTINGFKHN